jgi:hypothetical protein
MGKTTKSRRKRPSAVKKPAGAPKRRVNQEAIDEMAELRRQGLSFADIGARLGCNERTVRRYVGHVQPQLHLPEAVPVPEVQDPRRLREALARGLSDTLYNLRASPQPSLSTAFMAEATKLIQEGLEEVPPLTLELMQQDEELRKNFLRSTIGALYADYKQWANWGEEWYGRFPVESVVTWRPFSARARLYFTEDDFPDVDWLEEEP